MDNYKLSHDKHNKYLDFYNKYKKYDDEYWGIGIENESYLMLNKLVCEGKDFFLKHHNRERYSINYYENYNMNLFKKTLENINSIDLPIYINAYMFQNVDLNGEHKTTYTKNPQLNKKFLGITIDEYMKKNSNIINKLFENNIIYDGDTFEFTTTNFYKTNVRNVINELNNIKGKFIKEINRLFANKFIFKDKIVFPSYNYGFVKYMSNINNLGICNNGTYHINITLPTKMKYNNIDNKIQFKSVHANAIRAIQWIEPFIVALYGTPDILNNINSMYSGGSLRLMMSRYIGLGTFCTKKMQNGKLLNTYVYNNKHYFSKLHTNSPYIVPQNIGYDFNYNKFKKHGIELRIFDYFPEEYLEDIINFIILLCQHSIYHNIPHPQENILWNEFVIDILKNGSNALVSNELYDKIKEIYNIPTTFCEYFSCCINNKDKDILTVIKTLSNHLYDKYNNDTIVKKMSPNMKKIKFVDYNKIIKDQFKKNLH